MIHIHHLKEANLPQDSLLTIGVFDGVHRGHQFLVKQLVEKAHSSGRLAVVMTFFPHPDAVIQGVTGRYYLTTTEQRAQYLLDMGVDCVITQPFDDELRQLPALEFVEQLVSHLKLDELWVGADFAMGYEREGNVAFLKAQGAEKGYTLQVVDLVSNDATTISSTAIREALDTGAVEQAAEWLARPYSVKGPVVHGEQRGRKIGYPTANISVWDQQIIPANGVYAGWATLDGQRYMAVTNVGVRPTFDGEGVTVEAHLLDFDQDIYGQELQFEFVARLRGEQRFNGIDALIAQIRADADAGRERLSQP
jgi:riboflavin kinase/FMN adenylyltransferase